MTVLYAAEISALEDEKLFAAACAAVSPERRKRAENLYRTDDKRRTLAAELLLRHALHRHGVGFPESFVFGEHGKPYLPDGGLFFNLSHSGDRVICAVSSAEVGCDIERIGRVTLKTAKRFFTESEYEAAALCPPEEREKLLCRIWTLKESFIKAVGAGLRLPLDSFEVLSDSRPVKYIEHDRRVFRFREYPDIPGFCCAVCAENEQPDGMLRTVTFGELLNTQV